MTIDIAPELLLDISIKPSVTVSELQVSELATILQDDVGSLFHRKTSPTGLGPNLQARARLLSQNLRRHQVICASGQSEGKNLRCVGSGQLWSSTAITDGFMLNMTKMEIVYDPVYSNEEKSWTVEVQTEVLVSDLDDVLSNHNLPQALPSNVALESL
ncbi:hypothetical protein CPC16_004182 [Podila verticillata]|nr:hypothetical protein CPC16_004182 [Podila verticillata]KAI9234649.1 MAG: hypothetical protein BYD32DRAFT_464170 [Podila humilis]